MPAAMVEGGGVPAARPDTPSRRKPQTPAAPEPSYAYQPQGVENAQQHVADLVGLSAQPDEILQRAINYNLTGIEQDTPADAEQQLLEQLRFQRLKAIGADSTKAEPVKIKDKVDRLTDAEYQALSPLQKSAVDFNTQLVQAVRTDRRNADEYKPSAQAEQTYNATVEKIFGADTRDAQTYAPETLALLKQIGYQDEQASLDDFLQLNAAIRAKDLAGLDQAPTPGLRGRTASENGPELTDLQIDRQNLAETLATKTQEMQAALVKGNELLKYSQQAGPVSLTAVAGASRSGDVSLLGGEPTGQGLGYGNTETDQYFQAVYSTLVNPATDQKYFLEQIRKDLSPDEFKQFVTYVAEQGAIG